MWTKEYLEEGTQEEVQHKKETMLDIMHCTFIQNTVE